MNQLGWRNKVRTLKKQRDEALARVAELEAQGNMSEMQAGIDRLKGVANEYEAFKTEQAMNTGGEDLEKLKNELRAAKMREGRLKKQIKNLKK